MILGLLSMLALAGDAPVDEDRVEVDATEERVPIVTTAYLGGGYEPVRGPDPAMAVGRLGLQVRVAQRFAVELGVGGHVLTGGPRWTTHPLTQTEQDVEAKLASRPSDPSVTADLRVQFVIIDGALTGARKDVPFHLTLDVGGGAVATRDDLEAIECDNVEGEPCTVTARQIHPTPLLGTSLSVSPTDRLRIRGVLQYRTWIETIDGTSLSRIGSTTITLELGTQLGRLPDSPKRSRYQAPLPPRDPVYLNSL